MKFLTVLSILCSLHFIPNYANADESVQCDDAFLASLKAKGETLKTPSASDSKRLVQIIDKAMILMELRDQALKIAMANNENAAASRTRGNIDVIDLITAEVEKLKRCINTITNK